MPRERSARHAGRAPARTGAPSSTEARRLRRRGRRFRAARVEVEGAAVASRRRCRACSRSSRAEDAGSVELLLQRQQAIEDGARVEPSARGARRCRRAGRGRRGGRAVSRSTSGRRAAPARSRLGVHRHAELPQRRLDDAGAPASPSRTTSRTRLSPSDPGPRLDQRPARPRAGDRLRRRPAAPAASRPACPARGHHRAHAAHAPAAPPRREGDQHASVATGASRRPSPRRGTPSPSILHPGAEDQPRPQPPPSSPASPALPPIGMAEGRGRARDANLLPFHPLPWGEGGGEGASGSCAKPGNQVACLRPRSPAAPGDR